MKIAVHQMRSGIDPAENVTSMAQNIYHSANAGAVFYFAPEMSVLLDRDRRRAVGHICTETNHPEIIKIAHAAAEAGLWVHLGSMPVMHESGNKFVNRSLLIGPDGAIRARYDKMHLFDVDLEAGESWRESAAYVGGDRPVAAVTPLGLLGLTVCYDLRFSALYAALSRSAVDVIAVPSAFTVPTGRAHWHVLLRARAIEAQAYVVAAAQSGHHEDGRQTYGHSLVIDPWGEVLLDMGESEGLGFAEIDLERISEVRAQIPVHKNRRDISMPVKIF